MSAVVMRPCLGLLDGLNMPVAGDFAKQSVRKTFEHIADFKKSRITLSGVFNDLQLLAQESGVRVAEHQAFMFAQRFLLALPSEIRPPELAYDEEGEIAFDWHGDRGCYMSLTLRDDGRLSYAARFSAFDKEYGTKRFDNSIPKQVIELVRRVTQS